MRTIIGLDLGKFNSAACMFLTGDGEVRLTKPRLHAVGQLPTRR